MSSNERGAEGGPSAHPVGFTRGTEHEQSLSEELLQFQIDYSDVFFAAAKALDHNTQRKMLIAVNKHGGSARYAELEDFAGVSRRTVRKHAKNLEENGVLERSNSYDPTVSFPSIEVEALVAHVLNCYFNE